MTDLSIDHRALPVLDHEREQYHSRVRSYQAHITDDQRRRKRIWFWVAISAVALLAVSCFTHAALLPLKELIPLYLAIHEDGTVDTAVSLNDLGADWKEKLLEASVWRYVQERESYSYLDGKKRYDFVDMMTCGDAKHEYEEWFLRNPDGPQKAIGKGGDLSATEINNLPVRDGVRAIRFSRVRHKLGESEKKSTATATVQYETFDNVPKQLYLNGDLAAICVIAYHLEENSQ